MVKQEAKQTNAVVYCPACTHMVEAQVVSSRRRGYRLTFATVPGQKCSRCAGSLDAAPVLQAETAA